ncbi:MAG: aldehyde dehydrogenase family protein, partial [Planctomycetaceae bacterium]|nr:aldehyde dehydrogenase family protein [Planctomycetaceae bacterium]
CHRPGVCNAAESLVIDQAVAESMLPEICQALTDQGVEIRGCSKTCNLVSHAIPATESDFGEEYLSLIISVKVVEEIEEAVSHINRYNSGHTESIVTNDLRAANRFTNQIDASAVMVNASTRFNDGGEFGMGAEIGISTDKLHARGPCGLRELTSYKYVVQGNGQVR